MIQYHLQITQVQLLTALIQNIISQTSLTLTANVGGSDVSTASVLTRRRAKLTNPENNRLIFKLPYETIKTLKTTDNSDQTDTNFNVRRQFTRYTIFKW